MKDILIKQTETWQYWAELDRNGNTIGEYGICINPECDCIGYTRYW
ncbi:hypothetical protein LCGC14_0842510 [marine sediment metagenome]|uniref:Uncharacterized protein n=1 Tax=marine sediment metagenome TaxID=412755 RepID=A0A0F9SJT9_9ZZZZ